MGIWTQGGTFISHLASAYNIWLFTKPFTMYESMPKIFLSHEAKLEWKSRPLEDMLERAKSTPERDH